MAIVVCNFCIVKSFATLQCYYTFEKSKCNSGDVASWRIIQQSQ